MASTVVILVKGAYPTQMNTCHRIKFCIAHSKARPCHTLPDSHNITFSRPYIRSRKNLYYEKSDNEK